MTNLIGQSIGRYRILEQLGEGGMATVYKAFDTQLEREVAIKFIRPEKLGGESADVTLKRFKREARVLAKLTHPNILTLLDYGEFQGQLYLVTTYIPGGSLKDRLGRPMLWQDAVRLLVPVAYAMAYAHGQGILHRDLKPSNVLISLDGLPILADFGIAKLTESGSAIDASQLTQTDASQLTRTDVGIGTPEYMAPEQGFGKTDERSEIYSLGVVFYEMVTGHKPYTADSPLAVLMLHATRPLPPPRRLVPGLPARVEQVILKALAKQPEDRYQSMREFANTLEALVSNAKYPVFPARSSEAPTKTVSQSIPATEPEYRPRLKWSIRIAGIGLVAVLIIVSAINRDWLIKIFTPPITVIATQTRSPVHTALPVPTIVPTITATPIPAIVYIATPTLPPEIEWAIQNALNQIEKTPPYYETSFDHWDNFWQSDANANIKNGKLIADSQNLYDSGSRESIFASDRFAVVFDFRMQKTGLDQDSCYFQVAQENGPRGLIFAFYPFGQVLTESENGRDWEEMVSGSGNFDLSRTNTATIIILRNLIATLVNDQIIYTNVDPTGAVYLRRRLGASNGAVCEFDNYKLWNLTGTVP